MLKRTAIIFLLSAAFASAETPTAVFLGVYYYTDKLSAFIPHYSPDGFSPSGSFYVDPSNKVGFEMRPATAKQTLVLVCGTIANDALHPGYDGVAHITKVIEKFPSTDFPGNMESLPKSSEACGGKTESAL